MLGTVVQANQIRHQPHPVADPYDVLSVPLDGVSFMTLEDRPECPRRDSDSSGNIKDSWSTKIRQTIGRRVNSAKDVAQVDEDQSFIDMRKGSIWRTHRQIRSTPGTRMGNDHTPAQAYALGIARSPSDFAEKTELTELEKSQVRKRTQKLNRVSHIIDPHAPD